MLRTDYLAKQLVREIELGGRRYSEGQRASAREPTVLITGGARPRARRRARTHQTATSRGLALKGTFGGEDDLDDALAIAVDAYPDHDRALPQTLGARWAAGRFARGGQPPRRTPPIRWSTATRGRWRWSPANGGWARAPPGVAAADAGTAAQRELFAAVRENRFVLGADRALRPPAELLADPGVAATVLYRMAQAKAIAGVAPDAFYPPFVKDRVPPGISPAAVLGPFRNFQAKLLASWARAAHGDSPARHRRSGRGLRGAFPDERAEVLRIFVVTTFGATVSRAAWSAAGTQVARSPS